MRPFAILLVNERGIVQRANSTANKELGRCLGRPCRELVNVRDRDGQYACTGTCAAELLAQDEGARVVHGVVDGLPASVVCHTMDQETLMVMVRPEPALGRLRRLLTPREIELVRLSAQGLSMKEMARRVRRSEATVRTHLDHAKQKLGAKSLPAMVSRAHALGMEPEPDE